MPSPCAFRMFWTRRGCLDAALFSTIGLALAAGYYLARVDRCWSLSPSSGSAAINHRAEKPKPASAGCTAIAEAVSP
ncbi:exported hypothetical protein [Nitrolancea hollandica Lb]|uniref:Uncharacterized protein n=1 Tax=Nitrolancea hollandica Lb TaxID=1129897 RepID=I4ENN7_9BACT|nr:exported hypothetical protein [Nitrolancea hollandica Lb]